MAQSNSMAGECSDADGALRNGLSMTTPRETNLKRLCSESYDVLIVGGGINGAVSAAALAGRGASVALIDRGDFGSFTSQESSNLIWGGFKYLEGYEFLLVRKLSVSRNRLIRSYPNNIRPVPFMAALDRDAPFPPWLAFLGAIAYWGIGGFRTHRPRLLSTRKIKREEPTVRIDDVRGGIEYWDAYLPDNDSRFVFGFVRSALDVGATAVNYVELTAAERTEDRWLATLRDLDGGSGEFTCRAKVIVNAAGPLLDELNAELGPKTDHRIAYSKGIHLIVPRVTKSERILAFFDDTGRLFYVIPMGRRSVVGTTDTRVDNSSTHVNSDDREFLLDQINARLDLESPLTADDVIAERSGVRPLVVAADGSDQKDIEWTKLSRKHVIEVDDDRNVISIFGGKLTDCLNVGEEVAEAAEHLGLRIQKDNHDWYGEPASSTKEEFYRQAGLMGLDDLAGDRNVEPISDRLWRRYGERAFEMIDKIRTDPSMGEPIMRNADYLRVELHVAAGTEMITKLDDFLRRRSKISQVISVDEVRDSPGLHEVAEILFGDDAQARITEYWTR